MKAVLDEGVPRQIIPVLREWDCSVEPFPNEWKGLKNGQLLDQMEGAGFECMVTCDKNLQWQQTLHTRKLGVVVLPSQKLEILRHIAGDIVAAIKAATSGSVISVSADGR